MQIEQVHKTICMKMLEGRVRKACVQYDMINNGDRVAVGVSGGKDSVALLYCLAKLRSYCEIDFSLVAITVDPCFNNVETDYSAIEKLCEQLEVPLVIKRTELGNIIFDIRKEKNPCSLCARMRRGILHDLCVENGCNKIALGHHMDDVVETFFMNIFHEGRIASFQPKSYLSRKDITMIRPLVLCKEQEIINASKRENLPAVKSVCPKDGCSERQNMKEFINQKEKEYKNLTIKVFGALKRGNISGFGVDNEYE